VRPFQDALARHREDLAHAMGFGAASGLGSAVYALTLISGLLDEPALLDTAMSAAALLTDQRISVAPADVFEGLGGEILGLLALHEVAPEAGVLERAEACGRRLLSARTPGEGGRLAWVTFEGRMLTGFSHGTAGIAYALARLHGATGDEAYRSAAIDAIASENLYFDPDLGNWLDLREEVQPAFKAQWCHGAPGIGMARLGGLPMLDTEQVGRDIEAALRTTLSIGHAEADHVCCGNLGRADVLLVAGERLGRPDLTGAAHARVQDVVRRADEAGGFSLHHSLPRRVYAPGFFMGMAGVGYQLLRTAHPRVLPSVLLWELPPTRND
jgi:lantibiotic modifying enzyme